MGKGLRHALPHQQQRQHQAQRQQAIERGPGHVDPEVAQRVRRAAADTTAQGDQHGQAGGGADKILHGQPGHLAEVAQAGFTAVALPVGVGDKTHRGIERLRPLLPRQLLGVEWQVRLKQQNGEQQHKARQVENQQGQGVLLPALLTARVNPGDAVADLFDGPQYRAQPGPPALHHLVVKTPQPGCGQQHQGKKGKHQPIVITVHTRS